MEDDNLWHYRAPNQKEYEKAIKELEKNFERHISKELTKLAEKQKIVILAGDIGYKLFDDFIKNFQKGFTIVVWLRQT